jgi:hypothetical protein
VQAARRVEQQHVDGLKLGRMQRTLGNRRRRLASDDRQRRHADLLAQHLELFLRGRAVDVERRHQHLLALLLAQHLAELGRAGRLARALKADHHDDDRRRGVQIETGDFLSAQHLGQRIGDDLDDLLAGGDRLQHIVPDGRFRHAIDETAHHGQGHVGLQQGDTHFAHGLAHVGLAERTAPAQLVEHTAKAIGQIVEHVLATPAGPISAPKHAKTPVGETSPTSAATPNAKKRQRTKPRRPA